MTAQFTAVGVTVDARGDPHHQARSCASTRRSTSEMFGATTRVAAERGRRRSRPHNPYARGQALRAPHGRRPTASATACTLSSAGSSTTTSRRAGRRSSSRRKVTRAAAAIKLGLAGRAAPRRPRRDARLELRGRRRRGDVADAPAGGRRRLRRLQRREPHRSASSSRRRSPSSTSTPEDHVVVDPEFVRPPRSGAARRRPVQGAQRARLGAARRASRT